MADNIKLEVVTPEGKAFSGDVQQVTAPGTMGSFGILHNHAPLMSSLEKGVLEYIKDGKRCKMTVGGGFLEVKNNSITVLADAVEIED